MKKIILSTFLVLLIVSCGGSESGDSATSLGASNNIDQLIDDVKDQDSLESDGPTLVQEKTQVEESSEVTVVTETIQVEESDNNVTESSEESAKEKVAESSEEAASEEVAESSEEAASEEVAESSEEAASEEVADSSEEAASEEVADSSEQVQEEQREPASVEEEEVAQSEDYKFDHNSGKCLNNVGDTGHNSNLFGNCGDMNAQTIDGEDFSEKDLYGISLEDTYVTNSKVTIPDLVEYEAVINEGSKIDGIDNLMESLFEGYADAYQEQANTITQRQDALEQYEQEMENLQEAYADASGDELEALEAQIASKQAQINDTKVLIDQDMNKRSRQKEFALYYGEAESEVDEGREPASVDENSEQAEAVEEEPAEQEAAEDSSPGNSGNAPGKSGDAPGKSGSAPGQQGDGPGKSAEAPGQQKKNK